jgi:hypothetical protein
MTKKLILFSILAALLVAAPSAFASGSTTEGYGGVGGNTQVDIQPGGGGVGGETGASNNTPTSTDCVENGSSSGSGSGNNCAQPASSSADSLPFTGQDLGLITLVGAMFLLAGFALRRVSRREPTA